MIIQNMTETDCATIAKWLTKLKVRNPELTWEIFREELTREHEEHSSTNKERKYSGIDMLAAFKHGRNYESFQTESDIDPASLPENQRPFWEWLKLKDEQQQ